MPLQNLSEVDDLMMPLTPSRSTAEPPSSDLANFLIDLCRWWGDTTSPPPVPPQHKLGAILDEAVHQRLDRMTAAYFHKHCDLGETLRKLVHDVVAGARLRAMQAGDMLSALQAALADAGVSALARKGFAYDRLFYGAQGQRSFNDNDLLIRPQDAETARAVLRDQGFVFGDWSVTQETVVPFERAQLLSYVLAPDHLPRACRADEASIDGHFYVDVALSLAWHDSTYGGVDQLIEEAFSRPLKVEAVNTLQPEYHFIDCLMHNFREGYHLNYISIGEDVYLRKFLDVWLIWTRLTVHQRSAVRALIMRLDIALPAMWCCYHVDALFSVQLLADVGLADVVDTKKAFVYEQPTRQEGFWSGSMLSRVFRSTDVLLSDKWP